jgi:D-alanine-D-alanine ligase
MSQSPPRPPSRVAVIFGGPSPEHDVSVLTGLQALRALRPVVGELRALFWSKSGEFFEVATDLEGSAFADGAPSGAAPVELVVGAQSGFVVRRGGLRRGVEQLEIDAALNCCHGGPGEDGALQGMLDLAGIAYSGPSAAGAALGMDKLAFGGLVRDAGLPSLDRALLNASGAPLPFDGPLIVKPRFGGSSIGIDVVADYATARARLHANVHLRRGAVVEPYRPDLSDLQIAVRTWPELQLSAIERPLKASPSGEILNYADKYVGGEGMSGAPRELPAVIPEKLAEQIRSIATELVGLAGLRGVARVDFLADGEQLYVNEVNTIPGSLSRHMFIDPPVPFAELLSGLLDEAVRRPAAHFSVAGADGTVLRRAGSIAAKLA